VDDQLSGAERERAETHLLRCEPCRTSYRQLTHTRFPRIRNYTIVAELGRGGFGVVYKAVHHSKERFEALKVLFTETPQREAFFENEVRLAAALRHPNIATLFDAHLKSPPLYYAMEFVPGQRLDHYLRDHELSLEQRIGLVRTVASAMGYAHRQGVIHRDLKPQNILIDQQGQPRIVDFGIAKRLVADWETQGPDDDATQSGGAMGTFGYSAPEQLSGQKVDWRADIYALGALLCYLITGQSARFAAPVERLAAVLRERHVSRGEYLAAIIACCMNPDPARRYTNCEALVEDLDAYVAGGPIHAQADVPAGSRLARVVQLVLRYNERAVQTAVVVLLVVLLTGALWLSGSHWLPTAVGAGPKTALVAFLPSTLEALQRGELSGDGAEVSAANRKSWRVLYGRLMTRLAEARPRAVVWDYFFPDCHPQYDKHFIDGVRALGVPVVVGSETADVNGEPRLCKDLREAVHGWGLLAGVDPLTMEGLVHIPLAVQRGVGPPIPSLALAVVAAVRHPECDFVARVEPNKLFMRYCKRLVSPGEVRWHEDPWPVSVSKIEIATVNSGAAQKGDRFVFGGVDLTSLPDWVRNPVPMESVFWAGESELRDRFADRVVLIGQMLPPADQWRLPSGEAVFGCQLQAVFLDRLVGPGLLGRLSRPQLVGLVCASCLLAAVAGNLLPVPSVRRIRVVSGALLGAIAAAFGLLLALTAEPLTAGRLVTAIVVCSAMAAAGATLLVRLLHARAKHLAPVDAWRPETASTSTTLYASPSPPRPSQAAG